MRYLKRFCKAFLHGASLAAFGLARKALLKDGASDPKQPLVNGSTVELLPLTGGLKEFNQFLTFLYQARLGCFHLALHQWVPQVC